MFSEPAAVGDCVSGSCKCRVVLVFVFVLMLVLGFEERAIMGHLVGYEEFAAWVEEGGEDGGDSVDIGKVVVGLGALGRERRDANEQQQRERSKFGGLKR